MKKFLPLALAAALAASTPFSLACGSAEVVISIAEDGSHYVVEGVVGNRYSLESYSVPAVYDDGVNGSLPVAEIGEEAFMYCSSLREIDLPESVAVISARAFAYTRLGSLELPEGLTSIGYAAFAYCAGLKEIEVPVSVTELGMYAFAYCTSLERAVISADITDLPYGVLKGVAAGDSSGTYYDTKLKELTLPASLERISTDAFSDNFISDIYFGGTAEEWRGIKLYKYADDPEAEEGEEQIIQVELDSTEVIAYFSVEGLTIHCTDADLTYANGKIEQIQK